MIFRRRKPKICPVCLGYGFIMDHGNGKLSDNGNKVIITRMYYKLCPKCRGAMIVGIPELGKLSAKQIQNFAKGKTVDYFLGKTHEQLNILIQECK